MNIKDVVLRALSTFGWSVLGYMIIAIPLWIIITIVVAASVSEY